MENQEYSTDRDILEVERRVELGQEMSKDWNLPQQTLYTGLRNLHISEANGLISTAQARRERAGMLQKYGIYRLHYLCAEKTLERRRRMERQLTDIRKNGCSCCRKAVDILEGLE